VKKKNALFLCDWSAVMARPWANAGYRCYCIDIKHPIQKSVTRVGKGTIIKIHTDILLPMQFLNNKQFAFVAAFPPCTDLASSGARWFEQKGPQALVRALNLVDACCDVCENSGAPWMLENPVGRLSTNWRKPDYKFDPCDYAGYLQDPSTDAYTKKTCLWTGGGFIMPKPKRVHPVKGSMMHRMAPSPDRAEKRSMTPAGFAQAIFEANHHR
jgi:hypothetical protein